MVLSSLQSEIYISRYSKFYDEIKFMFVATCLQQKEGDNDWRAGTDIATVYIELASAASAGSTGSTLHHNEMGLDRSPGGDLLSDATLHYNI